MIAAVPAVLGFHIASAVLPVMSRRGGQEMQILMWMSEAEPRQEIGSISGSVNVAGFGSIPLRPHSSRTKPKKLFVASQRTCL